MQFQRKVSRELIEKLKKEPLFNKLKNDREVFPAVRDGSINFYYGGGRLFSYDGRFRTHHKYASVIKTPVKGRTDVTELDLKAKPLVESFMEGYDRIKENCINYAGDEARGVAEMCSRFSFTKNNKENRNVLILDVEIGLSGIKQDDEPERGVKKSGKKWDRIDLLLFHTKTRLLRFFEVKTYYNSEIKGSKPKIGSQIRRYRDQLRNKYDELLEAYSGHIDIINQLFNLNLDGPERIDLEPRLLVFGYDRPQQKEINNIIKQLESKHKLSIYGIGGIERIKSAHSLFVGGTNRWPTKLPKE